MLWASLPAAPTWTKPGRSLRSAGPATGAHLSASTSRVKGVRGPCPHGLTLHGHRKQWQDRQATGVATGGRRRWDSGRERLRDPGLRQSQLWALQGGAGTAGEPRPQRQGRAVSSARADPWSPERALPSSHCPPVLGPSSVHRAARAGAATTLSSGRAFLRKVPGPASSELGPNQTLWNQNQQVSPTGPIRAVTRYPALSRCSLGGCEPRARAVRAHAASSCRHPGRSCQGRAPGLIPLPAAPRLPWRAPSPDGPSSPGAQAGPSAEPSRGPAQTSREASLRPGRGPALLCTAPWWPAPRRRAGASFLSATSASQPARPRPLHPRRRLANPYRSLEGVPHRRGGRGPGLLHPTPRILSAGLSGGGGGGGPQKNGRPRGRAGTRGSPGARGPSPRERNPLASRSRTRSIRPASAGAPSCGLSPRPGGLPPRPGTERVGAVRRGDRPPRPSPRPPLPQRTGGTCATPAALGRHAYRSSLFAAVRSVPSPAAGGGGDERGASAEAGGAAMELQASALTNGRGGPLEPQFGACRRGPRTTNPTRLRGWAAPTPPPRGGIVSPGKDPTPRVATNSAAHNPWKTINKHLFDTAIFNTYS